MDGNQPTDSRQELPPVQPGQTFRPGGAASAPAPTVPSPVPPAPSDNAEPVSPAPYTSAGQFTDSAPVAPVAAPESVSGFEAAPDDAASLPTAAGDAVSWTASEFIAHEKTSNWYILLLGGAFVAAVVVWLITKDIVSSIVIVLAVGVLAAYARRSPRELQYTLDEHGITIGEKHYPYANFRSFSIIEEGAFSSIELLPLKRFSPPISVYYDPANEDAIAEALTPHLPFQPREQDAIDKLMRRIRF